MLRGPGGTVFEPIQEPGHDSRDRELTLGPAMLVAMACGLLALCGLCFVFGYSVGHRGAESASAVSLPAAGIPGIAQPGSPQAKPSAVKSDGQPQQLAAANDQHDSSDTVSAAAGTPEADAVSTPPASSTTLANSGDSAAHTALTGQPVTAPPVPGAGARVEPVVGQNAGIMVQIAAVSHPEDADVLVGALRKRGYTVFYRHDPADGLLHVQVGPFANRNDALAIRQKLLNDGYNAIIQP